MARLTNVTKPNEVAARFIESAPPPLKPVFLGLRISLHLLVSALVGFVVVRQILTPEPRTLQVIGLAVLLFATYVAGAILVRAHAGTVWKILWLIVVSDRKSVV